ncbi:hypothetical protein Esti_006102 [Eimeria stiedai]
MSGISQTRPLAEDSVKKDTNVCELCKRNAFIRNTSLRRAALARGTAAARVLSRAGRLRYGVTASDASDGGFCDGLCGIVLQFACSFNCSNWAESLVWLLTQRRLTGLGASSERLVSRASRGILVGNLPVHPSRASCSASFEEDIRTSFPSSPVGDRPQPLIQKTLALAASDSGMPCMRQRTLDCSTGEREGEAMPPQREGRARDSSAAVAAVSSSCSNSSSGAARHDKTALRGSSARGRSSEPSDAAEGSSSERAAAASSSSARRNGGRGRHGAAIPVAALADASSSSSSSKRRQSQDNNRRSGGGVRSSSIMHQTGDSLDRPRSSSGSVNSNCSDEQEEEATCPLCMEALDETDRGLFPCECGYQAGRVAATIAPTVEAVCLWCLQHIRDHLANKCPACRRNYDEKKFKYDQSRVVELTKQVGRKSRDKICGSSDATRSGSSGAGSSSSRSACAAAARSGGPVSSSSCGAASSSSSNSSKGTGALQHGGGGAARHGSREAAVAPPAQAAALKDVRVIQRCLVYVIGIPPSIAKKEVSLCERGGAVSEKPARFSQQRSHDDTPFQDSTRP